MTLAARLRSLLRLRLFSKILIANAVLVTLAAVAGALAGAELAAGSERQALTVAVPVVLAGLVLTVLIDAVLLQFALEPLHRLERAAERVRRGDLTARASRSTLADRDLSGVVDAFNDALERVAVYRQKLAESAARAVRREEAERDRISRALQEETAQRLAALLVQLRIAAGERQRAADLEDLLEETRTEIAAALDLIRGYAADRRPRVLNELGLEAALEAHAHELEDRGLAIEFEGRNGKRERRISSSIASPARRWTTSSATRGPIGPRCGSRARRGRRTWRWRTAAEASTWRPHSPAPLGLFEMRERAATAGGSCVVESRPGGGTRVLATVPGGETPAT